MAFQVQFSEDGAQLISGSYDDGTVIIWDVASGRRVHQLLGELFVLVEGLDKKIRRVITVRDNMLLIHDIGEEEELTKV